MSRDAFHKVLPLIGAVSPMGSSVSAMLCHRGKTHVFKNLGLMHRKPSGSPKVCLIKRTIFYSTTFEMTCKVICTMNSPLESL